MAVGTLTEESVTRAGQYWSVRGSLDVGGGVRTEIRIHDYVRGKSRPIGVIIDQQHARV